MQINEAIKKETGKVELKGWVYRERKGKAIIFLVLRDSTDIVQCVLKKENFSSEEWEKAEKILIETSMKIEGEIKEDKRAPTGYEVNVHKFEVVGGCENFPITKDQSPEFLLDQRHLWIRSRKLTAIFKIRSAVFQATREFFDNLGYTETHCPVFTPNACEGGANLFEVKYFGDKVYLTQSWQLYAEALIFGLEKIYTVAPCFRAEKSKTSRHLTEFWMAEMEAAWLGISDIIGIAEKLLEHIVKKVLAKNRKDLEILQRDISKLEHVKTPFEKITYTDALKILEKDGIALQWGKDLRTIEEDALMKHFIKPVIVTHYPKEIMAFYKQKDEKNEKVALCFDMLAPEGYGEIVGGSQRDTNMEELKKALAKEGENIEKYQWYLDLRKYGSVPHAGFGMGMERVIAWICGLDNIKDTIPFPRTMLRKSP